MLFSSRVLLDKNGLDPILPHSNPIPNPRSFRPIILKPTLSPLLPESPNLTPSLPLRSDNERTRAAEGSEQTTETQVQDLPLYNPDRVLPTVYHGELQKM